MATLRRGALFIATTAAYLEGVTSEALRTIRRRAAVVGGNPEGINADELPLWLSRDEGDRGLRLVPAD